MKLRKIALPATALILLSALAAPAPALADPATDGFWYFDVFHIQDAHDAGLTGEGVTIAVIDGQINLEVPTLQGADIEVQPSVCWDADGKQVPVTSTDINANHATNVVSFLVGSGAGYPGQTGVKGIAPDAKILFFSTGVEVGERMLCNSESGERMTAAHLEDPIGTAIFAAVDAKVDLISISQGAGYHAFSDLAVAHAVHAGIPVIVGIPNEQITFEGIFPSAYNGVVGVQSLDANAQTQGDHVSPETDVAGPGVNLVWQGDSTWDQQRYATGTSLATPNVAGFLALVAQKYPDATGNQLIQTLIRNTSTEDHELSYDDTGHYGYGAASATHMLRVDPTVYEDVNPLITDREIDRPTRAQIENPPDRDGWNADDFPTDEELSEPSPFGETGILPLIAILAGGLVLVVLVVVLIVVLATRRARRTRTTPPA